MSLKYIDGFDQFAGQAGAALLSSLVASGYQVSSNLSIEDGRTGSALELMVSAGTAGQSWSGRTNNSRADLHDVAANSAGRFVAVGDGGNAVYSDDTLTWLPLVLGVTANMKAIENNGATWITVGDGGTILRSSDGRNYSLRTSPIPAASLRDVYYGANAWVIVGVAANIGIILFSVDDGLTWSQATTSASLAQLNCVIFGTNAFCAAGNNGVALTSPDGFTWTQTTTVAGVSMASMAAGNDHILGVSDRRFYRSLDGGVTWGTMGGDVANGAMSDIVNSGNRWIAITQNGLVLVSDNETTWTPASFTGASTTPLYGICAAAGARVGYAIVGALNRATSPASAQRSLIYLSMAPPTDVTRRFTTNAARIVVGFAHRSTARGRIFSIKDLFEVDWPSTLTIGENSGTAIPARNVWYYYELVLDRVAKTVTVYINNTLDLVAPLPDAVTNMLNFDMTWITENGAVTRIDNLYLLDNLSPNGEALVDRLGPIQVPLRLPTADAGPNQWASSGSGAHWPEVGILPPSTESYIRSAQSGAQDLFLSNTAMPAGDIIAVGLVALAQKGDIDNRQLGLVVGAPGSQIEVVDTVLSVTPEYSIGIFEKAPGNQAWDQNNILTVPFGVVVRP